jgi:hypothetical protein
VAWLAPTARRESKGEGNQLRRRYRSGKIPTPRRNPPELRDHLLIPLALCQVSTGFFRDQFRILLRWRNQHAQ